MVETADQILRHIEAQRSQMSSHVSELEEKVKETVNWRVQLNRHPGIFVGAGFVGAALLLKLFSRR